MPKVLSQDDIDRLLTAISSGEPNPEEVQPTSEQRNIKIYDFKRPDKFSKDQLRTIQMMHETFARHTTTTLSTQLRSLVNLHVASVDQLSYEEFVRSIPNPAMLAVVNMEPLSGSAIIEIDPSISFAIIDRLFGGLGEGGGYTRELTEIEVSVMESVLVRMLTNIREAWSSVIDLRPRLGTIETNPQFAQVVPSQEMVVLVTLETRVGDIEGMMNVCIPYLTIEPIISKLSAQYLYSSVRQGTTAENLNTLRKKLAAIDVTLLAEIGSMQLSLREVLSLKVGDIVRLDGVRSSDPLVLKIEEREKYYCRPGRVGKKMAVQITGTIGEIKKDEIIEFAEASAIPAL